MLSALNVVGHTLLHLPTQFASAMFAFRGQSPVRGAGTVACVVITQLTGYPATFINNLITMSFTSHKLAPMSNFKTKKLTKF